MPNVVDFHRTLIAAGIVSPKAHAYRPRIPQPLDQMAAKSAVDILADRLWERYFSPKDIGLEESFKSPELDKLVKSCDWAGLAESLWHDRAAVRKSLPADQAKLILDGLERVASKYFKCNSPLSHRVYLLSEYAERLTQQAILRDRISCGGAEVSKEGMSFEERLSFEERYDTQFGDIVHFLHAFEVPFMWPKEKLWRDAAMMELKRAYGEKDEEKFRKVYGALRMLAGEVRARVVDEFKLVDI